MKLTEADVVWTPVQEGGPDAGAIRVERRDSGWKRTLGDRGVPAHTTGCDSASTHDDVRRSSHRGLNLANC